MLNRIRRAARAFRAQPNATVSKKAPYAFPVWLNGQARWVMDDFGAYVGEGFNVNAVIYSAVMFKAKALAKARLRAYRGDPENPVRLPGNHPLAELVARPNPHQSWLEFQQQRVVFLNLAGNSYTWLDRPSLSALPRALYNLRPDRVTIVPDTNGIKGYVYTPDLADVSRRMPFLAQDVIHVKFPNPGDPLEGMGYGRSPLSASAQSGDVDNAVTSYLKLFFEGGAMVSGVLQLGTDAPVDDNEIARIKERWRQQYGGYENWNDIAVIDAQTTYQRTGMTAKEMGFDSIDTRNESRILGPFGVPPILVGTRFGLERSTFSNAEEARKTCWEDTLLPELDLFAADDEYYLRDDSGAFVMYDTSTVPALQRNVTELVTAAKTLFDMGTPRNLAFAAVGLKIEATPDGDVGYLPFGLRPVGEEIEITTPANPALPAPAGDEGVVNATEDERDGGAEDGSEKRLLVSGETPAKADSPSTAPRWDADAKARLWTKADTLAVDHEAAFRAAARDQFGQDERDVLAVIAEFQRKSLRRKAAIMWESVLPDLEDVFRQAGERWRSAFVPLVRGVVGDAALHWELEAGLAFDLTNLEAVGWFDDYVLTFSDAIQDTSEREIAALLQQGQREGWSVPQMQKGLTQMFRQWIDGSTDAADFAGERLPPYRTEAIVRTETMRSYNAGSDEIYRAAGVQQKEWLAAIDNRTRDAHAMANGQIVNMDAKFVVGGYEMNYPGDPNAPPETTINCRCVSLPVITR